MAEIKVINDQSIAIGDLEPNNLHLIKVALDFYHRQRSSRITRDERSFIEDFVPKLGHAVSEFVTLQK